MSQKEKFIGSDIITGLVTPCMKTYPDAFIMNKPVSLYYPSGELADDLRVGRYVYVNKSLNTPNHRYFCNHTKYLPQVDKFAMRLMPNVMYTTAGQLLIRKYNATCFKKS